MAKAEQSFVPWFESSRQTGSLRRYSRPLFTATLRLIRTGSETEPEAPALIELLDDSPRGRSVLSEVFRGWANSEGLRVLFTPDVLIAVNNPSERGYLYDDGWTVECWIERGVHRFLESLETAFDGAVTSYEVVTPSDSQSRAGLLDLAIENGDSIDLVRHLI